MFLAKVGRLIQALQAGWGYLRGRITLSTVVIIGLAVLAIAAIIVMGAVRKLEWAIESMMFRAGSAIALIFVVVIGGYVLMHKADLPDLNGGIAKYGKPMQDPPIARWKLARRECLKKNESGKIKLLRKNKHVLVYRCVGSKKNVRVKAVS